VLEEDTRVFMAAGADYVIKKPMTLPALRVALEASERLRNIDATLPLPGDPLKV
jgi:hypothetical protein